MAHPIMDGISIIFGLLAIIVSGRLAKKTSDFYYNLLHRRFSVKGYQIGFFISGVIFIILGILSLLGIIKSK